jgi:phage shock protein A
MYPILERHDVVLSQIPLTLTDVQREMFSLGEQTKATGAKVDDWIRRQDELRGQLNKFRGDLVARIDSAKKEASDASTALFQRLRSEVAAQIDSVKAQLARLEAANEGGRAQIAGLEEELAQVRSQVNQQSQELASVQARVDQNAASNQQERTAATTTQQRDRRDFDTYADKFAVKRVDFEVTNKHGRQVAPGISLQVDGTDVSYQQVNGSIWVIPDRRTIWSGELKVQEPLFLSSFADSRTRKLVITRVSGNGAAGYMLIPAQPTSHPTNPAPAE